MHLRPGSVSPAARRSAVARSEAGHPSRQRTQGMAVSPRPLSLRPGCCCLETHRIYSLSRKALLSRCQLATSPTLHSTPTALCRTPGPAVPFGLLPHLPETTTSAWTRGSLPPRHCVCCFAMTLVVKPALWGLPSDPRAACLSPQHLEPWHWESRDTSLFLGFLGARTAIRPAGNDRAPRDMGQEPEVS